MDEWVSSIPIVLLCQSFNTYGSLVYYVIEMERRKVGDALHMGGDFGTW